MLSRHFLSWAEQASAGERAEAAGNLARAHLYAEIDAIERGEVERAMTCLLDDPSPLVRRALAEALGGAAHAPRHLVASLAVDQADIAAPVLARSPLLGDALLIDAVTLGEGPMQCAVASRTGLSAAVAGALAEVGTAEAVLVLCRNRGAAVGEAPLRRILQRFGHDGATRHAIGARPDLGAALRHELAAATAEALRDFVTGCGWMAAERARRATVDAVERAAVDLAARAAEDDGDAGQLRFAGALRRAGRLTPALIIRAILGGRTALFEAALAELSGEGLARVAGVVRRHDGLAFAALVRAAGLPDSLVPVFRAALRAHRPAAPRAPAMLRREVVSRVLDAGVADGSVSGLTALLRRLESEAAREESRAAALPRAGSAGERAEPGMAMPVAA